MISRWCSTDETLVRASPYPAWQAVQTELDQVDTEIKHEQDSLDAIYSKEQLWQRARQVGGRHYS